MTIELVLMTKLWKICFLLPLLLLLDQILRIRQDKADLFLMILHVDLYRRSSKVTKAKLTPNYWFYIIESKRTLNLRVSDDCSNALQSARSSLLEILLWVNYHLKDTRHDLWQTSRELLGRAAGHCSQYINGLFIEKIINIMEVVVLLHSMAKSTYGTWFATGYPHQWPSAEVGGWA